MTIPSARKLAGIGAIAALLAMILGGLGGCAMIDRMSGVAETKRIQESGVAARARILEIWDTGITVNEDPVIGIKAEVTRADGTTYTATIPKSLISRLDIPRFQPGAVVDVRIDPQDSSKVALDAYKYR
ncbi:MAG TPA: DUF3592 domain-containing protein [Thermoanaerobaculia bacterium]|jgi:hypothetical protein|nr:DUF3592 domain-containing protein [Thermoanaerobaculia bacterium]